MDTSLIPLIVTILLLGTWFIRMGCFIICYYFLCCRTGRIRIHDSTRSTGGYFYLVYSSGTPPGETLLGFSMILIFFRILGHVSNNDLKQIIIIIIIQKEMMIYYYFGVRKAQSQILGRIFFFTSTKQVLMFFATNTLQFCPQVLFNIKYNVLLGLTDHVPNIISYLFPLFVSSGFWKMM
jgi:hypothetical protein